MFEGRGAKRDSSQDEHRLKLAWLEAVHASDRVKLEALFINRLEPLVTVVKATEQGQMWLKNGGADMETLLRHFASEAEQLNSITGFAKSQHAQLPNSSFELAHAVEEARMIATRLVWSPVRWDEHLVRDWKHLCSSFLKQTQAVIAEQEQHKAEVRQERVARLKQTGRSSLKPLAFSAALSLGIGASLEEHHRAKVSDQTHVNPTPIQPLSLQEQARLHNPAYERLHSRIERSTQSRTPRNAAVDLHRSEHSQRTEANIESVGEGRPFGTIEFTTENNIQDVLWVTSYTKKTDGYFETTGVGSFYDLSHYGSPEARVHLSAQSFRQGEWVTLPTPAGYIIVPGSIHLRVIQQEQVINPRALDLEANAFQVQIAGQSAIDYQIAGSSVLPQHDVSDQSSRSPEARARTEHLRSMRSNPEAAVREMASDKMYITSNELADIYHAMRVPMSLIAEHVGALDCDTASQYVAGELNQSGIDAGVVEGYVAQGNTLTSNPHAKLLIRDVNGRYKTVEVTSLMSRLYPARKNLVFRPSDYEVLARLALSIGAVTDQAAQIPKLDEFRHELERILQDPWYNQFNVGTGLPEIAPKSFVDAVHAFFGYDIRINPHTGQPFDIYRIHDFDMQAKMVGLLYLLSTYLPIMLMADKKSRKNRLVAHQQRKALLKKIVESSDVSTVSDPSTSPEFIARVLRESIQHEGDSWLASSLKETDLKGLSPEKQQVLAALLLFIRALDKGQEDGIWESLAHWTREAHLASHWQRMLSQLEAGGLSRDQTYNQLRERAKDPDKTYGWKEHIREEAERLIIAGAKQATVIRRQEQTQSNTNPSQTVRRIMDKLGLVITAPAQERSSTRMKLGRHEMAGLREYAAGDPLRAVDWKSYARDPRRRPQVVLTPEEEMRTEQHENLHLIIDLTSVDEKDMERLTALLFYASQRPDELRIKSFTAYAYGRPCLTRNEHEMTYVMARVQESERPSELKRLLMDLQTAAMREHVFPPMHPYDESSSYWKEHQHPVFDQVLSQVLDPVAAAKGDPFVAFGSYARVSSYTSYPYEYHSRDRRQPNDRQRGMLKQSKMPSWMQTVLGWQKVRSGQPQKLSK